MADGARNFTVAALAERLEGCVVGPDDVAIAGVNALAAAGPDEITFIADERHARQWPVSTAAAAVVTEGLDVGGDGDRPVIRVRDAELAVAILLELFQPPEPLPDVGVHPTAWVHPSAAIPSDARIGPHASVERDCVLGHRVALHAGVRLYAEVRVGDDSVLHANTVVRARCRLGQRVILHSSVSIGTDGFGFRAASDGEALVKMAHIGDVVIEDDVEIGANSCVDRAKFGSTVVGAGTKIDNLVQIGHNCRIGRDCVVAGLSGLSGSSTLGDHVTVGGCVGIGEHHRIGDGAVLGGGAGVTKDVPAGETWFGYPAHPAAATLRQWAALRKLADTNHGSRPSRSVPGSASTVPHRKDAPDR
jgi:UDP-3-O-[3-hydroxymyristoyl] glucosamine N-acyltransferase